MPDWTYVGECAALKEAATEVIRAWDSGVKLGEAVTRLRELLMIERRYSWTEDYYDIDYNKGEK